MPPENTRPVRVFSQDESRFGLLTVRRRWETKPSAEARRTGYRKDRERHKEARKKVSAKRRREIASMGGKASSR
jgi:hypothetical protein